MLMRIAAYGGGLLLLCLTAFAGAWYFTAAERERAGEVVLAGGPEARPGGPFALTDHRGRPLASSDLSGRVLLLYFGYSQCNEACPIALHTMSQALEALPAESLERVQPLFVTIDPTADTPEALALYLAALHPRFAGLTGAAEEIAQAAAAYGVPFDREARQDDYGNRRLDHGTFIYLMGADGAYLDRFGYRVAAAELSRALEAAIRRLPAYDS